MTTFIVICSITMMRYFITTLIVLVAFREVICQSFATGEGPYVVIVHNTSSCVVEQPWFHTNVSTRGQSLLHGSVVIKQVVKDVKFRIGLYYFKENKKVKTFEIKNVNCRNIVVRFILTTINAQYDTKKCSMSPNTWTFSDMNLDSIVHMSVTSSFYYGVAQARWEIYTPGVRLMCLDINLQLAPLKGNT